jgi:hypothetical protein
VVSTGHAGRNVSLRTLAAALRGGRPRRRPLAGLRLAVTRRLCMTPAPSGGEPLACEREARDIKGMPWRHPEYLTRPLRGRYEKRLKALAAAAWPSNEHEKDF